MKKALVVILFVLLAMKFVFSEIGEFQSAPARRQLRYVEEFYTQYKLTMHYNTDNLLANIHWLQLGLYARFDHPIRALALIRTPEEHVKYKSLFKMRLHFLIMKSYLMLGRRYDKENVYYFNREYKRELLTGFEIARIYYTRAEHHWGKVESWANEAWKLKHLHLIGSEMDKMQNEMYRIVSKDKWINHKPIIEKLLLKLKQKEAILQNDTPNN